MFSISIFCFTRVVAVVTKAIFDSYYMAVCVRYSVSDGCCSGPMSDLRLRYFFEDLEPEQPFPPVESVEMTCQLRLLEPDEATQWFLYWHIRPGDNKVFVCTGRCRDIRPGERLYYNVLGDQSNVSTGNEAAYIHGRQPRITKEMFNMYCGPGEVGHRILHRYSMSRCCGGRQRFPFSSCLS
ncbi:hypothetical protein MRB53_042313 [Persea americana]|nr:hypothetical protein MRB53_042313 [Persea americana]